MRRSTKLAADGAVKAPGQYSRPRRCLMTRLPVYAGLVLLTFSLAALAAETTVKVSHNSLEPSMVSITAGDTVTFENTVEMPGGHTIVANDNSFKSPALAKGQSWSHTFSKAGTYAFHVKEHPDNKGKIVVK
jgi:plastocyanin